MYSSVLVGKNFLYVYGEEYFEVSFPSDRFLHLTGVETTLSASVQGCPTKFSIPYCIVFFANSLGYVGMILALKEILFNTDDRTGLISKCEKGGKL